MRNKAQLQKINSLIIKEKEVKQMPKFYEESYNMEKFKSLVEFKEDTTYERCNYMSQAYYRRDGQIYSSYSFCSCLTVLR